MADVVKMCVEFYAT